MKLHPTLIKVIGVILITLSIVSCKNKELERILKIPIVGDLYEVRLDDGKYTIYRVFDVEGTVVTVYAQKKVVDTKEELSVLIQENNDNTYDDKYDLYISTSRDFTEEQRLSYMKEGRILNAHREIKNRRDEYPY